MFCRVSRCYVAATKPLRWLWIPGHITGRLKLNFDAAVCRPSRIGRIAGDVAAQSLRLKVDQRRLWQSLGIEVLTNRQSTACRQSLIDKYAPFVVGTTADHDCAGTACERQRAVELSPGGSG